MNVAMGAVLKQWHDFREEFAVDKTTPLPDIDALRRASVHTDISCIEIDEENMTVFITDENVSLDVGAVAKGFATEIVCDELSEKYDNFLRRRQCKKPRSSDGRPHKMGRVDTEPGGRRKL